MTVLFLTEPTLERAPRGRYRLVTPLVVALDGATVVVPQGFETDGASIPTPFWPLISHPLAPSSLRAAILHDYQCRERLGDSVAVHRLFWEGLKAEGCATLRATLMYWAVRLFGPRFS